VSLSLPLAHGIGGVKDLPVPAWLFYYGGAVVLVLSFVALGALWKRPLLAEARPRKVAEVPRRWLRIVLGAIGFGLYAVVTAAALFGENESGANLAPTFVYVVFWLGMPLLTVFLGNVWAALNPWKAAADAVAVLVRGWRPPFEYPKRLGRWPAALLLLGFAALELAWYDPSSPHTIAIAIIVYSWITWLGMAAFGRDAWLRGGEAFTVYLWLLSRIAPVAIRGRRLVLRPPFSALAGDEHVPGTLATVSVMLGSVAFDGFSRTTWWQNRLFSVQSPHIDSPHLADLIGTTLNLGGLALAVLAVAASYLAAVKVAERFGRRPLRDSFLLSLVPIAFAYLVAHYFSLFVLQGQVVPRLVSDPFGFGWDLFGTAGVRPDFTILRPRTIWYVQVGALVVGHVIGLAVAHDRAISLFRPRAAVRTQYAMLGLMVLYTVGGMWILSRP
jgi:hypothetical protein